MKKIIGKESAKCSSLDSGLVTFSAQHPHTDIRSTCVLKHTRYMWLSLSLSLYKVLITQVLDNTGDVNPVEVVVPVYALGIETKAVIFPVLPVVVCHHRRPQPRRVGVIEASFRPNPKTGTSSAAMHASQNAENVKKEKALIGWFNSLPSFEQGVWRIQLCNMHDVSVRAAELVVAPGESAAHGNVQQAKDLEGKPEVDGHVGAEPGEGAKEAHPARRLHGLAAVLPAGARRVVEEVALERLREDGVGRRLPRRRRQVVDAQLLRLLLRVCRHGHHHAVHHHVPRNLCQRNVRATARPLPVSIVAKPCN